MNHKHLFYFWKVAKLGSVAKAAEAVNVTPQTLSGQINLLEDNLGTPLFSRQGRHLALTDAGRLALDYAEEMFALSAELEGLLKHLPRERPSEFRVGVSDALPKSLAFELLRPALSGPQPVHIICREWRLERLLAELAGHRLDLVISDEPIPPTFKVRAYNHRLLQSGLSWLATPALAAPGALPFPACLGVLPLLLPGEDSGVRHRLDTWFERQRLHPRIVGEFDDTALMAAFGRAGIGAFPVPTLVEGEFVADGQLLVLGRSPQVKAEYFAISVERRLTHPCVLAVTASARRLSDGGDAGSYPTSAADT